MKIAILRPGLGVETLETYTVSSEFLQSIVGGFTSVLATNETPISLVCNDEAMAKSLPPCAYLKPYGVVYGPIVAVGDTGLDMRPLSLSETEAAVSLLERIAIHAST